jgi:hypothetical protein
LTVRISTMPSAVAGVSQVTPVVTFRSLGIPHEMFARLMPKRL